MESVWRRKQMVITIETPLDDRTVTPIEVAIGDRVRVVLWDFGVVEGLICDITSEFFILKNGKLKDNAYPFSVVDYDSFRDSEYYEFPLRQIADVRVVLSQ
jgi:hypothetical protein